MEVWSLDPWAVGRRTGCGDQSNWHSSLWVKVGPASGRAGRQGLARLDGVSAVGLEQWGGTRTGSQKLLSAAGSVGGSWSPRRRPEKAPQPPWHGAQCCLPSGITKMLIIITIAIAAAVVWRMFLCARRCAKHFTQLTRFTLSATFPFCRQGS